jgi:phytanoyl-CoA dioxygenase PhyH
MNHLVKTSISAAKTMSRRFFRTQSDRFEWLTVPLWNNWNRLDLNLVHAGHHLACRARYLPRANTSRGAADPIVDRAVSELRRDGFCRFGGAIDSGLIQRIGAAANKLLSDPDDTYFCEQLQEHHTHLKNCVSRISEIPELMAPAVEQVLERAFGSFFKIHYIELYRIHATKLAPRRSWLWHSDNHPGAVLKIMIYLTPSDARTGALRAMPWRVTRGLYRRGFRDRTKADAFTEDFQNEANHVVFSGDAGTVLVFDHNVIHKATAPEHGHRDCVVFQVVPSLVPWREHFPRIIDKVGTNQGVPATPFF